MAQRKGLAEKSNSQVNMAAEKGKTKEITKSKATKRITVTKEVTVESTVIEVAEVEVRTETATVEDSVKDSEKVEEMPEEVVAQVDEKAKKETQAVDIAKSAKNNAKEIQARNILGENHALMNAATAAPKRAPVKTKKKVLEPVTENTEAKVVAEKKKEEVVAVDPSPFKATETNSAKFTIAEKVEQETKRSKMKYQDLDAEDIDDPVMVYEYVEDILVYWKKLEVSFSIDQMMRSLLTICLAGGTSTT